MSMNRWNRAITNQSLNLLGLAAAALLVVTAGCATQASRERVAQTEQNLTASGFKAVPVATPVQQQQLQILPAGRVSAVKRMGKVYFVYPDVSRNVLYVGNNDQYLHYSQLAQNAHEQALVKQEMQAIDRWIAPPTWEAAWGDWDSQ
jgi:hypothetical protein